MHFVLWNGTSFLAFPLRSSSHLRAFYLCAFYLCLHWSNKQNKKREMWGRNHSHCPWSPTQVFRGQKWVVTFVNEVNVTALPKSHESHQVNGDARRQDTQWLSRRSATITDQLFQTCVTVHCELKLACGARQDLLTHSKFITIRHISLCHLNKTTWNKVL